MEAAKVIYLLKAKEYELLQSLADNEVVERVINTHSEITTKSRVEAANKYLDGPGQHISAYYENNYQLLTNGHSAIFLTKNQLLDVENVPGPRKDLTAFLRTPPGDEVKVVWMSLHLELELHKGADDWKKPLYVKVGRVCVNAELLSQTRAILGGEGLRVYQKGSRDTLQLESENGKAIVLPALPGKIAEASLVDVTGEIPA